MDRLRRSLRESFRKKKDHVPECSKPHQWQADEAAVRAGTCCFSVKYLGCVEVYESRGMQVCEEALKMLRNSRRRPVKGILYVTGDGLRVVDEDTKGLIVDQTIEKVSFCAPDRNHEKGFSYICRDGTTRRWMCHGFLAMKDSGERLSHAVGCAFAACLERKQKRDKECGVTMTFDPKDNTFTRMGSFRQTTLTERMQDPQDCKITDAAPPPVKQPIHNPFAIERPHATPVMLQRQGSFRGFVQLNQTSPFKRQLSLRLNDLPSNLERQQRSMSLESSDFSKPNSPVSPEMSPRAPRNRLHSLPATVNMSPIPESSPVGERTVPGGDSISVMCQQLSRGLTLLSNTDDPFMTTASNQSFAPVSSSAPPVVSSVSVSRNGTEPLREQNPWGGGGMSRAEMWLASSVAPGSSSKSINGHPNSSSSSSSYSSSMPSSSVVGPTPTKSTTTATSVSLDLYPSHLNNRISSAGSAVPTPVLAPPRRAPHLAHLRSQSLGGAELPRCVPQCNTNQIQQQQPSQQPISTGWSAAVINGSGLSSYPASSQVSSLSSGPSSGMGTSFRDPFDAEWAALAARSQPSTNPFAQNSVKAFEVHM